MRLHVGVESERDLCEIAIGAHTAQGPWYSSSCHRCVLSQLGAIQAQRKKSSRSMSVLRRNWSHRGRRWA